MMRGNRSCFEVTKYGLALFRVRPEKQIVSVWGVNCSRILLYCNCRFTNVASTFLSTRNFTPHDRDGQPLEKVYQTSMSFSIVFRDIRKLSEVVGQLLTYSNVEISSIDWSLSEATQKALGSQVRREVIHDAVTKANDYAAEVGREVYAVDIMDGGQNATMQHAPVGRSLFGSAPAPSGGGLFGGGATVGFGATTPQASQSSEMLSLSPQNIKFTSSVHIEFQSYPEK